MLRMTSLFIGLAFVTFLSSCTPETQDLFSNSDNIEFIQSSTSLEKMYLEGKSHIEVKNFQKACQIFTKLAAQEKFVFKDIFIIRKYQTCSSQASHALEYLKIKKGFLKIFSKLSLETSIELTARFQLKPQNRWERYLNLHNLKSKNARILELQKLTQMAKKSNDPNFPKYYNLLIKLAPRFSPSITDENIYRVARDLEKIRKFQKARDLYLRIIKNDEYEYHLKIKSWNSYRTSFKVERRLKDYLKKTQDFVNYLYQLKKKNPRNRMIRRDYVDYKIILVRAYWTENENKKALKILEDLLEEDVSNKDQVAMNHWLQGRIYKEEKQNANALNQFRLAASISIKSSSLAEKVFWDLGWMLFLEKDFRDSINSFKKSRKYVESESSLKKFTFWQAMAHSKLNETHEATELWQALASRYTNDYYGLLSHLKLHYPINLIDIPKDRVIYNSAKFEWFKKIEEKEIAIVYLKALYRNSKSGWEKITILPLFHTASEYQFPLRQYYNIPDRYKSSAYLDLVYPTPYQEEYSSAQTRFGTSKFYLMAISRQESLFDPFARSWADAFGVMQLIPERAKKIAVKHNITYSNYLDLYKPSTNILMGAALMGDLKVELDNKFVLHTASYNASISAVRRWYKTRFNGDFIQFIENIPYSETRNYIKLVLRNYFNYKRMLGDKEFYFDEGFFESDI